MRCPGPTAASPRGLYDLRVTIDGKELYRRYLAPWYYSVDIRPDLHFVSMDSYDWPAPDRVAPSAVPSTWGGQVRDPQFEWLADDLRSWRATNPMARY